MMCTHLAEVIPLRGCQVVEAETTAGMHQKLVESLRRYCVWPGISPSELGCGQKRTGPRSGDDRTPHGMAGNRWLARCRPAVTLKASEGKTSKKSQKQVTIDNTAGVAALCYSVARLVSMRVDVTVLH